MSEEFKQSQEIEPVEMGELKKIALSDDEIRMYRDLDFEESESDKEVLQAFMEAHGLTFGEDIVITQENGVDMVVTTKENDFFTRDVAATQRWEARELATGASDEESDPDAVNAALKLMNDDLNVIDAHTAEMVEEAVESSPERTPEELEEIGEVPVKNTVELVDDEVVEEPKPTTGSIQAVMSGEPDAPQKLEVKTGTEIIPTSFDEGAAKHNAEMVSGNILSDMRTVAMEQVINLGDEKSVMKALPNILMVANNAANMLNSAWQDYDESLRQTGGHIGPDYNPHMVLAGQLNNARDLLSSARGQVALAGQRGLRGLERGADALEATAKEAKKQLEVTEKNHAQVIREAKERDGSVQAESVSFESEKELIADFDGPLATVRRIAGESDETYGELSRTLFNLDQDLNELREKAARHQPLDPDDVARIIVDIQGLTDENTLEDMRRKDERLEEAIDIIQGIAEKL